MQYRCPKCGEPLARTALETFLVCTRCRVGYPLSDLEGYSLTDVEATRRPPRRAEKRVGCGIPVLAAILPVLVVIVVYVLSPDSDGRGIVTPRPTRTPGLRPSTFQTHRAPQGGLGTLEVDNGTSGDGFVRLALSARDPAVVAGAVRAGRTLLLEGIPDGSYLLWFCTGSDWRPTTYDFALDYHCQRFEDSFLFSTTATPRGWTYGTWEVTLHTVVSGNAETRSVEPDNLPPLY